PSVDQLLSLSAALGFDLNDVIVDGEAGAVSVPRKKIAVAGTGYVGGNAEARRSGNPNARAAMEAAFESPCCEPAHILMKSQDEAARAEQAAEAKVRAAGVAQGAQTVGVDGAEAILFKSPTCPNCKAAMALLDRAGVEYAAVNAADARELTARYGVRQAPTLVVRHGDDFEKYRGVSDIKGWLMTRV
ncbi:MAG: glutaredoxin family protein, partial [Clostridia bacterium]|nr:glutaredoxin family protein [Clostridia bacterium]